MSVFGAQISLLLVAHILLAGAATYHALLYKQDVRSAIGWIGLAWLSPFVGPLAYWLLGINRVRRRAALLGRGGLREGAGAIVAHSGESPALLRELESLSTVGYRVTERPLVGGNAIRLYRAGDEAYPAMLDAIRAARRSVALSTYIFRNDHVGQSFVDALADRRAAGCEVRVLVDGIGGGYLYSPIRGSLRRHGIPFAQFLHDLWPWRMPMLNMRTHKKFLILDGQACFTGGLNIGAENCLAGVIKGGVDDTHFRVDGPVVAQLMTDFAEDWRFTTGESLRGDRWFPSIPPSGGAFVRGISDGPDKDIDKLETILLAAMSLARESIRIVTPYFLPHQRLYSAVALAALRGVAVEIIMPEACNHIVISWAARGQLRDLITSGCRIRLSPAPFDHSKLMTVDGTWSLIGSANWDERSLRLNFEYNVEIFDLDVARAIDAVIDEKVACSRLLSVEELDARPLPVKLLDAMARLFLPYL